MNAVLATLDREGVVERIVKDFTGKETEAVKRWLVATAERLQRTDT